MTPQEANKIIAEFMGYYFIGVEKKRLNISPFLILTRTSDGERVYKYPYSESLDALVSVWEKLNLGIFKVFRNCTDRKHFDYQYHFKVELSPFLDKTYTGRGLEIQEDAAIATAKAILELKQ